ncbi:hypothetical protein, partial [Candidatus Frankia nodulisporulans]|uniref:hypothetical protein n=1 Tax=Candidatus Frankia nodulisporulans TaxID=2060052 RepID=UPI001FD3020F
MPRGRAGLPHRRRHLPGALGVVEVRREADLLERDVDPQQLVVGMPDRAHPTGAKPGAQPPAAIAASRFDRFDRFDRASRPDHASRFVTALAGRVRLSHHASAIRWER